MTIVCRQTVYDPDDDNGRTDDDDEDEFQSSENVSLPILNYKEKKERTFSF